jgi:molybdenum cofactor cytidylyltransferase
MGRNKLLLVVGGRTILDRVLNALEASVVDEIVVVLGHDPEVIEDIVEAHGVNTVLNIGYEKGMTSSFQAGLRETAAESVFLVLGDQLGLDPVLLDVMMELMASDPDALIVSSVHKGIKGHPVLFRRGLFREILDLKEEETMKDVVDRHESDHRTVEGDMWCTMDVDTPEDFERAVRLFEASRASP